MTAYAPICILFMVGLLHHRARAYGGGMPGTHAAMREVAMTFGTYVLLVVVIEIASLPPWLLFFIVIPMIWTILQPSNLSPRDFPKELDLDEHALPQRVCGVLIRTEPWPEEPIEIEAWYFSGLVPAFYKPAPEELIVPKGQVVALSDRLVLRTSTQGKFEFIFSAHSADCSELSQRYK